MKMLPNLQVLGIGLSVLVSGLDTFAFYNPSSGKWLGRDPIEEDGGPIHDRLK